MQFSGCILVLHATCYLSVFGGLRFYTVGVFLIWMWTLNFTDLAGYTYCDLACIFLAHACRCEFSNTVKDDWCMCNEDALAISSVPGGNAPALGTKILWNVISVIGSEWYFKLLTNIV